MTLAFARVRAGVHAVLVLGLVVAPALVLRAAGDRGGGSTAGSADILVVSAAVGALAAALAWRRAGPGRTEVPPPGRWSAELASLGVLAPLASALPALGLHTAARLPADLATEPWLAPAVWGAGLLLAVLVAAGVHRAVLTWLRPASAASPPGVPARRAGESRPVPSRRG